MHSCSVKFNENLDSMVNTVPFRDPTITISGSTAAVRSNLSARPAREETTEFDLKVGSDGEFYVYEWLKKMGCDDYCWTSALRKDHGFRPFGGDEGGK